MGKIIVANDLYPYELPLAFWFNPDLQGGVDGSSISSMTDISGGAKHATQATGANQAIMKTNLLNGRNFFRVTGGQRHDINQSMTVQEVGVFFRSLDTGPNFNSIYQGIIGSKDSASKNIVFYADGAGSTLVAGIRQSSPVVANTIQQTKGFADIPFSSNQSFAPIGEFKLIMSGTASSMTETAWRLFQDRDVGGRFINADFGHIMGFTRQLTTTERDNLTKWFHQYYKIYSFLRSLVFDGNSLTTGFGSTGSFDYPSQVVSLLGNTYLYKQNAGVSGQDTPAMISDISSDITPRFNPSYGKNFLLAWELSNQIYSGVSAVTSYTNMVTYCTTVKIGAGWKVGIGTCLYRGTTGLGYSLGNTTACDTVNASLRADFSIPSQYPYVFYPTPGVTYADFMMDFNRIPQLDSVVKMDDVANSADGTHLNNTSYSYVAQIAANAISLF